MNEHARARGRAYALVAKLLLEGLDADTLALVRALPGWLLEEGEAGDLEQLIAEHHASFQLGVFPYAGVFLDRTAVAGAGADSAFEYYERAEFRPRLDAVTGDHLGIMVAFLAYACPHAQFDAIVAEFLDTCVLSWLPALVVAAEGLDGRFWPRVLNATLELCAEHRLALPHPRGSAPDLDATNPLADEHTGLRQIAEHLLAPAASGLFLSRDDIARLGRMYELPRGFGSRVIMLDNLLRSAVEHQRMPDLLGSLDAMLVERDGALARLAATLELHVAIVPWRSTITHTRRMLEQLGQRAGSTSSMS